uniref:Hypothetical chloroplast RF1 n=1 Tax=Dicloster acuatus TaxID=91190 RepID=A0A097KQL3_9CHLO|nr:hypothetical chloroplast RF1 [Dicloster acuatus]AIT95457.1 hypothetical chloroplast RF1 [Dicloster acuatus]
MSVVSSIRDYVEFLNTLSDSLGNDFTLSKFITETCFYFLKTLQYCVYYLFSLEWLRDFTLLPVTIPQISQAIFAENLFLQTPEKTYFDFLEIPSINENKFFLGFCNSFFLTLPVTVTHIISIRRLIIQGIPAAIFSFSGFILGQTLFIFCVIFGIRSILIPWLSLEPLNYIIGFILIFQLVYSMVQENLTILNWNNPLNQITFLKFFLFNFVLSWCEQSCIFQYFSNITISQYPSLLEGFSTKTTISSIFIHSYYIYGIFLGSCIFSLFWGFTILQIKNILQKSSRFFGNSFIQNLNKTSFVVILGFTLSSIPFYGLDYLITGPLGFVSQDNVFKNTFLAQNFVKDPVNLQFGSTGDPRFELELSSFDRGHYLLFPENLNGFSFEDFNYRGELDWTVRREKENPLIERKHSLLGRYLSKYKVRQSKEKLKDDSIYTKANKFLEYTDYSQDKQIDFGGIEKRFNNWYTYLFFDPTTEISFDKTDFDVLFSKIASWSFITPSNYLFGRQVIPIEKTIKEKYYSNPIYKALLAIDIDLFLNRQPSSAFLGGQHELDLYKKRTILQSYYDSLRLYKKLPIYNKFENFFDGTKSFTNKVYNQQFKGTLRAVRRLFSLSLSSTEIVEKKTNSVSSILKYDQSLYQNNLKFFPYHEEIPEFEFFIQKPNKKTPYSSCFLQEIYSKPFYAGWDENLRKFIITNKIFPRKTASSEINFSQDWHSKFRLEKQSSGKNIVSNSQKINFSLWPKTKASIFNKPELFFSGVKKSLFTTLGYAKIDSLLEEKDFSTVENYYYYFPSNMVFEPHLVDTTGFRIDNIDKVIQKRGGFVWPGTLPLANFPF